MGKSIYISHKEIEAINDALDTLETNCEAADEEYIKNTIPSMHGLYNIKKKYYGYEPMRKW